MEDRASTDPVPVVTQPDFATIVSPSRAPARQWAIVLALGFAAAGVVALLAG